MLEKRRKGWRKVTVEKLYQGKEGTVEASETRGTTALVY
jgi:hypothetical protein